MTLSATLQRHAVFLPFAILFASAFFLETSMHRVVFYLLSAFLIAMICREKEARIAAFQTKSFFLVSAYGLFFTASTLWGDQIEAYTTFRAFVDVICISVFGLAIAVAGQKFSITSRHATFMAILCVAVVGVYALIFYGWHDRELDSRFYGQGRFYNPIHMSILLSMAVLFVFSAGLKGDVRAKALQILLVLAMVFFIVLSQTRSSLMGLGACIFMLFVMQGWRCVLPMIAIAIISFGAIFLAWGSNLEGLYARGDTHRFAIWKEVVEDIQARPLLGHGISSEPDFAATKDLGGYKSAHNFILGHLYFGGVAGLLLALTLLGNALCQSWRAVRFYKCEDGTTAILARFTFLSLVFCIVTSLFNFSHYMVGVHIQWLIFWLPIALAWYLETVNRKQNAETP